MKKSLLIAAKLLVVVLVAWFVRGTLVTAWEEIGKHPVELHVGWLILSGVIYLVGLLPAGWYWHHVLNVLGQEARLGETLQAYYLGHLGKYVPGKAMVIILRTGLIRSHRVDTTLAVVSVFYETLTMMAVGSFLSAGILMFLYQERPLLIWASLAFMLAAGLPTLPPVFRLVLRVMQKVKMKMPARPATPDPQPLASNPEPLAPSPLPLISVARNLTYATVLIGWASMTLVWLAMAASLWAVFRGCGLDYPLTTHLLEYTVSVSLPIVAGFAALIPAGLVVRDLLSVVLLPRLFNITAAPAVVTSAMIRVTWLLAELIIFAILYPLRLKLRRSQSEPRALNPEP